MVASAFCHLLKYYMVRRSLKGYELAESLGITAGMLSKVMKGERYPDKDLDPLANELGLEGQERHEFLVLGYLARSNPLLSQVIDEQREEIQKLKKQLEAVKEQRKPPF